MGCIIFLDGEAGANSIRAIGIVGARVAIVVHIHEARGVADIR